MKDYKVDILLATHNGEEYIEEQLLSIQAQTYDGWRILVSDDHSTDSTLDIILNLAQYDDRIRIVSSNESFGGAKYNFFNLLNYTDAPYVMFCDQDDVWLPDKIDVTLNGMLKMTQVHSTESPILVFTDMVVVDDELSIIDESFMRYSHLRPDRFAFNQLLAQAVCSGCTMMMNRSLVDYVLGSTSNINHAIMHDWWISLVAAAFGEIAYINRPTSLYRQHESNEVGAKVYSPLKRLFDIKQMINSVSDTIEQAQSFKMFYGDYLSKDRLFVITKYSNIGTSSIIDSYLDLIASRSWKYGLRKAGQLLSMPFINQRNPTNT